MDASVGAQYEILHSAVPGRLRIAIPGLKNDGRHGVQLEQWLRTQPAVHYVKASSSTGNLTVAYDQFVEPDAIVRIIDRAGDAGETPFNGPDRDCWWAESVETVLARLDSSTEGLATTDIARRRHSGDSAPSDVTTPGEWQILLRQFNSLPVWLLGASSIISLATGGLADAALIAGIITANAAIGFFTDRRAERILQAFIKHEQLRVMVRRDGGLTERLVEELVAGDIILVQPGNIVAADARIISSVDLQVVESMLTGESVPVMKSCTTLPHSVALFDRTNMLYAGTVVMSGSGIAVVVATGGATEAGQIKALVASTSPAETPLQRQFNRLGTQLTLASIAASGLVFGLGFLRGVPLAALIRTTTALAVAAIPEGLPTVATSILASGLREMQRNNVLVRQLAAVETLGAVTVICFDKTGTLTQNRMTAVQARTSADEFRIRNGCFFLEENEVDPADHVALHALLLVAALCNDSDVQSADGSTNYVLNGSSTENAIMTAAIAGGIDVAEARRGNLLLERTPRSDTRRYMITVHETSDDKLFVAAKGNPIDLLALCTHARSSNGQTVALTEAEREGVLRGNEAMTARGLRVLGFASVELPSDQTLPPDHLVWLGMIGMADPVRPDIDRVLRDFHDAGIHTVMVTGDQSGTALAIAHEVQLSPTIPRVIEGSAFSQLGPKDMVETAGRYDVFSRVSPAHKLTIVQALQQNGLTVAMTGDGTNDAPALRAADIGVAMGRHGTDAAREIADVVLAEDDLGTMVVAVRQGRTIYANMRKAVHFLVSTNSSEVFVTVGAAACGLGQPLRAGQLLWLNLVTDVAIAYSMGFEPAEYDVMQRPPRARDENIIRPRDYSRLALKGGLFSISALSTHLYGLARHGATGGGIAFSTLIAAQLLDGLSSRSETRAPWSLPENRTLTLTLLGTAALQGLVSVMPFTRRLLGLAAFDLLDLGVIAAGSLWPFLVVETVLKPNSSGSSPPPA